MKRRVVQDGEWIAPVMEGYKLGCCDCCLVHRLDFAIVKRVLMFRAFRDKRATAAARKRRGITVKRES